MKQRISDKDRTVVIVSHDRKTIADLCGKVLWLNDGELVQHGDTETVLDAYDDFMKKSLWDNCGRHQSLPFV